MKLFKRLKSRIDNYLFDSSVDARERSFMVFSVSEIAALAVALIVGIIL